MAVDKNHPIRRPPGGSRSGPEPRQMATAGSRATLQQIVELRIDGLSWPAISEKLGLTRQSVLSYKNTEMFRVMYEEAMADAQASIAVKAASLSSKALDVHRDIMEQPREGDGLRLEAAQSVLDRTLGKPGAPGQGGGKSVVNVFAGQTSVEVNDSDRAAAAAAFRAAARTARVIPAELREVKDVEDDE